MRKYIFACVDGENAQNIADKVGDEKTASLLGAALPNLLTYVWWVLRNAIDKNIETLYFLSHEGHILKQMADIIINKYNLPVGTHYLYCAAEALSVACIGLLPESVRYDEIFKSGYGISPWVFTERLMLSEQDCENIYNDICFDSTNKHTIFSDRGRKRFAQRLLNSAMFKKAALSKSELVRPNAEGYLRQEGLCSEKKSAVVSLGFNGSVQHCISILLKNMGSENFPQWFYFGNYNTYGEKSLSFYFSPASSLARRGKFNRHIISRFCAASHREVYSYAKKLGVYSPVLKNEDESVVDNEMKKVQKQMVSITEQICGAVSFKGFPLHYAQMVQRKINYKLFYNTTREQAEHFLNFKYFCGISEYNGLPLIPVSKHDNTVYNDVIHAYRFFTRLKRHFYNKSLECTTPCMFWGGATAALGDIKHRATYAQQLLLWSYKQF